ncbi:AbiH family protein [Segatella sp.]|uniref:AbiH family protein n=1 Tax=Segatella sp. TaxID=2974253 RepID=UPI0030797A75
MKKKYGTTLIIGNGFDLNLGMVTDYRSFFKKLKADGFFTKHTNNPLLQFINAKGEKEKWYDFEGIIQEYATRSEQAVYLKMIDKLLPLIDKALDIDEESFKEIKGYKHLCGIVPEFDSVIEYTTKNNYLDFVADNDIREKCVYIKKALSQYNEEQRDLVKEAMRLLKDELVVFLKSAKINDEEKSVAFMIFFSIMGIYAAGYKGLTMKLSDYSKKCQGIFPDFKIVSFNYTDTISNLVVYLQCIKFDSRIDLETNDLKENFYRIHGALGSEVIFGIDSECDIPNAFISLRKSNHISINAKQRFSDIIENSKRIIIFGHSIYGIDYEYYADFLKKNKDTEVVVLYHNEKGKKEFENELENKGVTRKINYEYIVISNHFFEFCENIAKDQRLFFEKESKEKG